MRVEKNYIKCIQVFVVLFFTLVVNISVKAQTIQISGKVTDADSGEPLPTTSVILDPKSLGIGAVTDFNGRYSMQAPAGATSILFSYVGYEPVTIPFPKGKNKAEVNVKLKSKSIQLSGTVITAEKARYRNKDNPAVELLRKAISNKDKNRIESSDFYEYKKYEKIELSFNELSDSVMNTAIFRNYFFLKKYIDTNRLSRHLSLPFFFRENIVECYYRRSPEKTKEFMISSKMTEYNDFIEMGTIAPFIDGLAMRTNIYDNTIMILDNEYLSPFSSLSPNFYKYHILDTLDVSGTQCISLSVYPRNDADFGFAGTLYIVNDSSYALKRAELTFTKNANINFVKDFSLIQEYSLKDSIWYITLDEMVVDFSLTGKKSNVVGKRTNYYYDYVFNEKISDAKFRGESQEKLPGYDMRAPEYWASERPIPLSKSEQGVYNMVEEMKADKGFNRIISVVSILFSGMADFDKFDFGPIEALLSFNDVEGARFRVGGKTNARLNPHLFFDGFLAYGLKDERFKYHIGSIYSFNKKKLHPWEYPINFLSVSYEDNTDIPGQAFFFGSPDRLLLSFHRGKSQQMVYQRKFETKYEKEFPYGWSIQASFNHIEQEPAGTLKFENASGEIRSIASSQLGFKVRFAPNERFYQVQQNRFPLNHTNPVFTVAYTYGLKNFWDSEYNFHRLDLAVDKRTWFSSLGFLDVWLKAGKIWNTVPFPLLIIHQANQNYAYQDEAFNMMNYMEFVSDQYASVNLSYCFNGWLFNRIPLIKKLKWREYFTFKALWGSVSNHNLPANNPDLLYFPADPEGGEQTTFALGSQPFMEANFAIDNIFKVLRIDLIKRLNYLDHPDIPEWGVRFRLRFVF